ncbi:MAG: GNAT family N-acetyltransferase [Miltoncostaeaceae bacterium]
MSGAGLDGRVPREVPEALASWVAAGVLGTAEVHVARLLTRLCGGGTDGRLLAAALRLSAARGATRMVLEVSEANAAARALYDAAGFSPVGRRRGYYRGACGAEDALVLARHLSGGTNEASD